MDCVYRRCRSGRIFTALELLKKVSKTLVMVGKGLPLEKTELPKSLTKECEKLQTILPNQRDFPAPERFSDGNFPQL
jgi:hypothetical protein